MGVKGGTVHGTWEDLFWHIDKGDYSTEYSLGEEIATVLNDNTTFPFQIVAFNADIISGTSNKAPVTLISSNLYSKHIYNPTYESGVIGTGNIGGWEESDMRSYLNNTVLGQIPNNVFSRLLTVNKYTRGYNVSDSQVNNMLTTDKIWIPSYREMHNGIESQGPTYTDYFTDDTKRVKKYNNTNTTYSLRTAYDKSKMYVVSTTGAPSSRTTSSTSCGVAVGICVGGKQT